MFVVASYDIPRQQRQHAGIAELTKKFQQITVVTRSGISGRISSVSRHRCGVPETHLHVRAGT